MSIKNKFNAAMLAGAITITPTQELLASNNTEIIIDNTQALTTGNWEISSLPNPYGENSIYSKNIGDQITWDPDLTDIKPHDIAVFFPPWYSRDNAAAFEVSHVNGVSSINIDQSDMSLKGTWINLGKFTLDNNSFVRLTNDGSYGIDGSIGADAVRFTPTIAQPPDTNSASIIIDNTQALTTGNWEISSLPNPYGENSIYSKNIGDQITWDPDLTDIKPHDIAVFFPPWYSRDNAAAFEVSHVNGVSSINIDQSDMSLKGTWINLGKFTLDNNSFVRLTNDGSYGIDGSIGADAVRFTPTIAQPPDTNSAPIAVDDNIFMTENTSIIINPLFGDYDPDGDNIQLTSVTDSTNSGVIISIDAETINYTPPIDAAGDFILNYTIEDIPYGAQANGIINITVIEEPNIPTTTLTITMKVCDYNRLCSVESSPAILNDVPTGQNRNTLASWQDPSTRENGACIYDEIQSYQIITRLPSGILQIDYIEKSEIPAGNCSISPDINPVCGEVDECFINVDIAVPSEPDNL